MPIKGGLTYVRVGLYFADCVYVPGTILHIPSSSNLEAASQYLPLEAFQRLFRRRSVVPCYLHLPATALGGGQCGIFICCRN